jgi:hypothetical protein
MALKLALKLDNEASFSPFIKRWASVPVLPFISGILTAFFARHFNHYLVLEMW